MSNIAGACVCRMCIEFNLRTGGPNSLHERGRDSCLRAVLFYKRLFGPPVTYVAACNSTVFERFYFYCGPGLTVDSLKRIKR